MTLERFLVQQVYEWKHLSVESAQEQRTLLSSVVVVVVVDSTVN